MITVCPFPEVPWQSSTWCRVCGELVWCKPDRHSDDHRCFRHRDRNPCAIEGCKKTSAANGRLALGQVLCAVHWRAFVQLGSPERRIYNRYRRRAKRFGWTDTSYAAFCRCWDCIVRRARARAAGDVDMREVNRLMGWDEAA